MPKDGEPNIHHEIEAHGNLDWAHWSDGPFCPNCGEREAIRNIHGQTSRPGIYHCLTCRKRFSGTLDILFQNSTRAAPPELPFMIVIRKIWGLRRHPLIQPLIQPLIRLLIHGVWYLGHLIRQIVLGSDPKGPKNLSRLLINPLHIL